MPRIRVVQKAYVAVLAYFASAPIEEASLVLDLAGQKLKERTVPPPIVDAGAYPPAATAAPAKAQDKPAAKAKVSTKQPAPKAAAAPVQRKKPGPKPGSHRRKKATPGTGPGEYVPPQAATEAPINEEIGDVPIDPSETSLFDEQQVIEPEPEPVGAE